MSNAFYSELWLITQSDMERLLELDLAVQSAKPTKEKEVGLNRMLPMYLKYRDMIRRLVVCHDQIIQTQKRELLRKVLDCAIGRMLEYKREIVGFNCSDYEWPDNFMNELKFTPDDTALPVPAYFLADRKEHLERRRKYIQDLIDDANKPATSPVGVTQEESISDLGLSSSTMIQMGVSPSRIRAIRKRRAAKESEPSRTQFPFESAKERAEREAKEAARRTLIRNVLLIQSHERARAARCIGAHAQRQYDIRQKLLSGELQPKKVDKGKRAWAATVIQKVWRGCAVRKHLERRMDRMEALLDMTIPSWKPSRVEAKDEENFRRRQAAQAKAVARLEERTNEERARVHRIRGSGLMEDITDELREWFLVWYDKTGTFDAFPLADAGGSILVATGQTYTPEEYLLEKWEKEKASRDKGGAKKSGEKKPAASENAERRPKTDEGWTMPESSTLPGLREANDEFVRDWALRDVSGDPSRAEEYVDLITDRLCYELQLEMREIVDELMRMELARLNEALAKDCAEDGETFVARKAEKEKKKKKPRKGKRDPLANTSTEDLFDELVRAKVIRNYPETRLRNWLGDLSYQNYEALNVDFRDCQHRLGEVKQAVMEYCVLPLGSRETHRVAPLVRSVCVYGAYRSGKSLLANAICTEVGALLFDLTPSALVGQYTGRKNQERLMNMIARVARAYAPSVVFVDGGEKPWWRKVPDEERHTDPKRLALLLPRFVKDIKPGDQVLFLSISSEPYNATKPFVKIHDKFIAIPMTDYNTLYMLYKNLLMKYHGVDRNFDVSPLAKLSVGLPVDVICETVERILTVARRVSLKYNPLRQHEIMDQMLYYSGLEAKVLERYQKFERQTPLGKRRAKMLAEEEAARASQSKKKSKR